jgi:hypothetical protein
LEEYNEGFPKVQLEVRYLKRMPGELEESICFAVVSFNGILVGFVALSQAASYRCGVGSVVLAASVDGLRQPCHENRAS